MKKLTNIVKVSNYVSKRGRRDIITIEAISANTRLSVKQAASALRTLAMDEIIAVQEPGKFLLV